MISSTLPTQKIFRSRRFPTAAVAVGVLALLLSVPARAVSGFESEKVTAGALGYRVVKLDPARVQIKLYWQDETKTENRSYQTLGTLRTKLASGGGTFLMATNSGIYDRQYRPLGLHVEGGKTLRPLNFSQAPGGNFSMVPNGVFAMTENGPLVAETSAFAKLKMKTYDATQSGPLLVQEGKLHPKFTATSTNLKLRSGVGVDKKGRVIFAVSEGGVSFYDFARFFRDTLQCPNALYLDGTISDLLVENEKARDQFVPFVGIWAAKTNPP